MNIKPLLQGINDSLKKRGQSEFIPAFLGLNRAWDEETVYRFSNSLQLGPFLVAWFQTLLPKSKEVVERLVLHNKGQGCEVFVVINGKFVVNTMQYRFAVRKKLSEIPRGIASRLHFSYNAEGRVSEENHQLIATANMWEVLERKLPKVAEVFKTAIVKVTFVDTTFQNTTFYFGQDAIYLVEITLPEFHGNEADLKALLNDSENPIHIQIVSLDSVINREFIYKGGLCRSALYALLPRLEQIAHQK